MVPRNILGNKKMKKIKTIIISLIVLSGCSKGAIKESESIDTSFPPSSSNTLVAYFSVTNNTKKLAGYMKEHLSSDIFEIVPKEAYTQADINYNSDCRANREQNDESARPEIKYTINDISQYDTIVLGYPIWWGQAPKILYTFIESYDFSNKTILPFCTSGSSPVGDSATNLAKSAPQAKWLEGKRFPISASKEEIENWLDQNIEVKEEMKLSVDNKEIEVQWENNDSTKALNDIKPLEISMHRYGGFEQVGPIGKSIVSHDVEITTEPGDIVLYSSNQIVIFFGSNTWDYTKLGHINMSQDELRELLDKSNVTINIK